jgi:hypothetical protein
MPGKLPPYRTGVVTCASCILPFLQKPGPSIPQANFIPFYFTPMICDSLRFEVLFTYTKKNLARLHLLRLWSPHEWDVSLCA